jgi:cytosine/adenosine deaminase-related metal-dependent hydrolase
MKVLAAKYVIPISSAPLVDGAVAIQNGKVLEVGLRSEVRANFPDANFEDFGEAAILPGLVNCHSHLEITSLRGALDDVEHDFRSWLISLKELRSEQSDEDIFESALAGAFEGSSAGVSCFGDIGRYGHSAFAALKASGLRGVVYQETDFSPDDRTADGDFLAVAAKYEKLRDDETDLVKMGISPHSPYTVSSRLFELIAQYSIQNKVPITIHASESAAEVELLSTGKGFFTEVYEKFGVEWNYPGCSPIHYLERLGVLAARPLLAHCVAVDPDDVKRIANYGATIAHCPKSNAKFGHGYAPLETFLAAGINVGLGSDSVASNNICDLFEEARFAAFAARNHPGTDGFISAREVLELATIGGARALGLDGSIGTLEHGKAADCAIVSLAARRQQPINDVYAALVFSSGGSDVIATMVAGKEIYRRPSSPD